MFLLLPSSTADRHLPYPNPLSCFGERVNFKICIFTAFIWSGVSGPPTNVCPIFNLLVALVWSPPPPEGKSGYLATKLSTIRLSAIKC